MTAKGWDARREEESLEKNILMCCFPKGLISKRISSQQWSSVDSDNHEPAPSNTTHDDLAWMLPKVIQYTDTHTYKHVCSCAYTISSVCWWAAPGARVGGRNEQVINYSTIAVHPKVSKHWQLSLGSPGGVRCLPHTSSKGYQLHLQVSQCSSQSAF